MKAGAAKGTAKAEAKAAPAAKAKAASGAKAKAAPAAKAKAAPAATKPAPAPTKPAHAATKPAAATRKPAPTAQAKPAAAHARVPRPTAQAIPVAPTADRTYAQRADLGAPADSYFTRQPAPIRAILEELRGLVESEVPDATSSLKWGMPVYAIGGKSIVSLAAHTSHVNLILWGPPDAYLDPHGHLSGEGKTGRHLKVTSLDDLPRNEIRGWVQTAADRARGAAR
ncbi:MAG TPA: DUF1801 domain-containing protein [Kofleriaceae bacterium]|nr:DUF1801 domain-containing protein [Kofleriaceae bacterium]